MTSYVALLRGINVGGSNLIRMVALKACFEAKGFRDVATYIQSGNVLFTAGRANQFLTTGQRAAQSQLSRVVGTPAYQNMTIRNWNTTVKLFDS